MQPKVPFGDLDEMSLFGLFGLTFGHDISPRPSR